MPDSGAQPALPGSVTAVVINLGACECLKRFVNILFLLRLSELKTLVDDPASNVSPSQQRICPVATTVGAPGKAFWPLMSALGMYFPMLAA